ncbi:GntR family transcriptional regulator [Capillimicrobium parvum]|uniref:D-xylose utilization operon transcriptional repressor n=1 Tax=Capillimicrobium parvum TaxID=2884022 RepID=A0A9E6XXJ8_9ACTN|nr:GntR family transcriptional regulator [Capillimicrobium parvum]UGS35587.1 putative D-xylose utilization operon transcriptional repressor [Capillimicrobium parvum]
MEKLATERHNVDAVHDRLRGAILRGDIPPGEVLQQVALAEELGVSRTPLREAFRLLQREGLLEGSPNRSYRVTSFSPRDLEELYVTFLPLQALAIRLTIPLLQSSDIATMMGDLAQMDHYAEAQDVEGWEVPHREFHRRLIQHAGRRVVELLDQLSDHAGRYRRVYLAGTSYGFEAAAAEHRELLESCRAGDTNLAAARLAHHLAHTALDVLAMADDAYEPHALKVALAVAQLPLPDER